MINVKLIVLFFSIGLVTSSPKYCEICPNHTLCRYTMPGPSSSCKEYEENPLTKDDVNNIVNKINEGRNFVATGLSKLLPQAANMNKIYWSDELATFAQRWVDQCDGSTRPDKEDECRDLEDSPVGQNIVTITGPSPGMHLTSLIDVWFMQKRQYTKHISSVSYYNQSRDWKTNYFTQLIWAKTDKIGCGRARFYADQKDSIVERLVCNFAPKGNVHGKPVYAIGYPATQCQKNKTPDNEFKGLCAHWNPNPVRPLTTSNPPVSSLLRVLNLSNNSVQLEIDPIQNNLKQTNVSETMGQRNQKTRHVFFNNSHAGLRNMPSLQLQNQWNTPANSYPPNTRGQRLQHYQPERGHSRVYHGHDLHDNNLATNYKNHPTENFRKYDYTTEQFSTQSSTDFRKYNRDHQCSRRPWAEETDCGESHQPNQCTRRHGTTSCLQPIPTSNSCPIINAKLGCPQQLCQCNTPKVTCATMPPKCQCNLNCQCFNSNHNIQCLSGRRTSNNDDNSAFPVVQSVKKDETRKTAELHYYDLLPNMAIRSGDGEEEKLASIEIITSSPKDTWLQHDTTVPDIYKRFSHKIRHDQRQVKEVFENKDKFKQDHDYMYDSSDSRERKKRSPADEVTFKPFWQMDEYNRDKSTMLKSMRYTTFPNKKNKKTKRTATTDKISQTTESITVKLKDSSAINIKPNQKSLITEKYLSFDELMHLRKLSTFDSPTDARRTAESAASAGENTASTTAEYTINTPFVRKKHCTRKLTCTWTAPTMIGADGSIIDPAKGGWGDRGSRTPPGYVEGCTRTSTCTREYMNRNKFATITDEIETETTLEDGDYCEKRALNIRRRDSSSDSKPNLDSQGSTDITYTIDTIQSYVSAEIDYISSTIPSTSTNDICLCYDNIPRLKRHDDDDDNKPIRTKRSENHFTYGDLYYLVLQKIIRSWKRGQNSFHKSACLCNSAFVFQGSVSILLLIFFYNLINLII